MACELEPPFIAKKRTGEWGKDCHIVRSREDEKIVCDLLNNSDFFCQEIIPGPFELATHIPFVGGRIIKALNIMYEFESEMPIKG